MLITVFMNLLLFPYQQLIPVVAANVLHVGPTLMGLLLAFEGLGALIGSIGIASWSNLTHHGRVYLFGSMAGLTMLLAFSFSQWYGLSLALMLMLGLGTAGFGAMQATIILLVARDDMRGRGLGVITLAIGAGPIGGLMLGWTADEIGAPMAMTIKRDPRADNGWACGTAGAVVAGADDIGLGVGTRGGAGGAACGCGWGELMGRVQFNAQARR